MIHAGGLAGPALTGQRSPSCLLLTLSSEVDLHELSNAVDQSSRIIATRFDFKGVTAAFERDQRKVMISAEVEFQLEQMRDMLRGALVKCGVDPAAMQSGDITASGKQIRQEVELQHGLSSELCKKIVKLIKDTKLKLQSQIQAEQVRVSGKKRDDLQQVMALLREAKLGLPLQFVNFRD